MAKSKLVTEAMQSGGKKGLQSALDAEVKAGRMTEKQVKSTIKKATEEPLVRYLAGGTDIQSKLHSYSLATPQERTPALQAEIHKSFGSAIENRPAEDTPGIVAAAKSAGVDTSMAEKGLKLFSGEAASKAIARAYAIESSKMGGDQAAYNKAFVALVKHARQPMPTRGHGTAEEHQARVDGWVAAKYALQLLSGR